MVSAMPDTETHGFNADVSNLMSHIIYHFYKDKDVVFREIISNSSDALDKHRSQCLQKGQILDRTSGELKITIVPDQENKQLIIKDTGIGMTKADMINYLGTIANSGTQKFAQMLQSNADSADKEVSNLIGQFGIGFYSSFLISDRVDVISKNDNEDIPYKWSSDASTEFTIEPMPDYKMERGTEIIMHLKEGSYDYIKESKIEEIVNKYSAFIEYDIYMTEDKTKEVEDEEAQAEADAAAAEEKKDGEEDGKLEEDDDKKDKEPSKKMKTVHYKEDKHLNKTQPVWTKSPDSITQEEFNSTYKSVTKSWDNPFMAKCFHIEAHSPFKVMIFLHNKTKTDVFESKTSSGGSPHVKMYHKRVFVIEFNKGNPLFESYLQSMATVILDVDDMPTSISRDSITNTKVQKLYMKFIKNKILSMIKEIKTEDAKRWEEFYTNHSQALKLGVHEDALKKDELLKLVEFKSANSDKRITLEEYVAAMPKTQEQIYFMTGGNIDEMRANLTVCEIKKRGMDVLLFEGPLDEFVTSAKRKYDNKNFQDISKEGFVLDSSEDAKAKQEKYEEEYKEFCAKAKNLLKGSNINEVKVKNNFVGAFKVQVPDYGMSGAMESLNQAQVMNNNPMSFMHMNTKTFCVNPENKVAQWLKESVMKDDTIGIMTLKLLADNELLRGGYKIKQPGDFCDRIQNMVELAALGESSSETPLAAQVNGNGAAAAAEVQGTSQFDEVDE